jgi:histidine ammonia-lyase
LDFLEPLKTGPEGKKAYELVREISKNVETDRSLAPDIEATARRIAGGDFSNLLR